MLNSKCDKAQVKELDINGHLYSKSEVESQILNVMKRFDIEDVEIISIDKGSVSTDITINLLHKNT
ncbi:hypothetical protein [Pseudoalteromonas sp. Of11M-6]|uniref:hypothetical protein n=1 Tax=Pseudoalteromonas sp. Of11M-6 TaxID=2917754 RepID=UPI001EF48596|nr:hypothetical protein [Pseudoalteromonas sp. Of11M-6]MCG7556076.1 hypothetical protein [Pseudoalteromonas sp. Of11M-6]